MNTLPLIAAVAILLNLAAAATAEAKIRANGRYLNGLNRNGVSLQGTASGSLAVTAVILPHGGTISLSRDPFADLQSGISGSADSGGAWHPCRAASPSPP